MKSFFCSAPLHHRLQTRFKVGGEKCREANAQCCSAPVRHSLLEGRFPGRSRREAQRSKLTVLQRPSATSSAPGRTQSANGKGAKKRSPRPAASVGHRLRARPEDGEERCREANSQSSSAPLRHRLRGVRARPEAVSDWERHKETKPLSSSAPEPPHQVRSRLGEAQRILNEQTVRSRLGEAQRILNEQTPCPAVRPLTEQTPCPAVRLHARSDAVNV